ncbi:hypothetical protein DW809_02205 [Eubacterium ventriosum]|nr:hypothetical protein DW809_02205 [Eubacterium ventriosum]
MEFKNLHILTKNVKILKKCTFLRKITLKKCMISIKIILKKCQKIAVIPLNKGILKIKNQNHNLCSI